MKVVKTVLVAALSLSLVTSSVIAAESIAQVGSVGGKVLVSKGKGFLPLEGGAGLAIGDKVMVGEGGFAAIAYPECTVSLDKPTVFSVTEKAPCDSADKAAFITPVADPVAEDTGLPYPLLVLLGVGGLATIAIVSGVFKDKSGS